MGFEKMMVMREKADVLQGILGALWLALVIDLPFTVANLYLAIDAIILMLSAAVIYLREESGLDVFGIFSVIWSIIWLLILLGPIYSGPGPRPLLYPVVIDYLRPIALFGSIILAIGLFLEAFDIIKPLKV